jgi:surface polysaccharide O-acyltransferase-like enzyme
MNMRIQSIDFFKGLAILAIVVFHTKPFLAIPSMKNDWHLLGQAIKQISSFGVPFFYVAAGYFFAQGIQKDGLLARWWPYVKRLSILLVIWVIIDAIFRGSWLLDILEAKSLSPLLANLSETPAFAAQYPDLFLLRGTAVPLWFLVSLIISISLLTLCIKLSVRLDVLLLIGFCGYFFSLPAYSDTPLGIGLKLSLEQRGPFIAFLFLVIGHFLAVHQTPERSNALIVVASILMMFVESSALSYFSGVSYHGENYLLSTILLATSMLIFALQNPDFGAGSIISKIGNRSLGIYLVHWPVLAALFFMRGAFISPVWEVLFPVAILAISYAIVIGLMKLPYIRSFVS